MLENEAVLYKNREGWLKFFGVCQLLAAAVVALGTGSMLFVARHNTGQVMPPRAVWTTVLNNFTIVLPLVILGVGSFRARRWARTLTLLAAWWWLWVGTCSLAIIGGSLGRSATADAGALPPGAAQAALVIMYVMFITMYIVIPLVVITFFRSRDVRLTCEACDTVVPWTDRRPPEIVMTSLWLAYSGLTMWMLLGTYGVVALFGVIFQGVAGITLLALTGALRLCVAAGLYRLNNRAWWVALGWESLMLVSAYVTFATLPPGALYEAMGFTQEQIATIGRQGYLANHSYFALTGSLPIIGLLLYTRNYFCEPGLFESSRETQVGTTD